MKLQTIKKNILTSKGFSVLIIIALFTVFANFETYRKSEQTVLDIITPTLIGIDLNGNKVLDSDEKICIPEIETFTSNLSVNQTEITKKLNLSDYDAIKLGYLTDVFAENLLDSQKVKLKFTGKSNQNCRFAEIYIKNTSYKDILLNSGFAFQNNKTQANFQKQLAKARKLNLVILNHKSNKFHKLDCKYGLIAHDTVIIQNNNLPKDAKPCKFCHISNKPTKKNSVNKTIPKYPLAISNGSVKMYLSDLTTKLKPDNKCSSLACQEILNQINNAKTSIDIATYGWDNIPEINNALIKAKNRGVKIQVVYDTSTKSYYPELSTLVSLADKSATDTPKILMHNKFMIFDNKSVITGSMNFAKTGFSGFNSNCTLFINSIEAAKIYQEEFIQMLDGKFHDAKSKINHKTIILGTTKITPFFSPKDKTITTNIIPIINNAKDYIYIPAFIITHDNLSNALIAAANRGVSVKLIIDATSPSMSRSKVKLLRAAGIPIKVENYAGKVHSKSIIIDDKYIITGSMNFSNSGENKNDENCLIIEDERLAKYYKGFFEYLWQKIPDKYLKINPHPEGPSSIGSCSDGVDNNFDGKIDAEDLNCKKN